MSKLVKELAELSKANYEKMCLEAEESLNNVQEYLKDADYREKVALNLFGSKDEYKSRLKLLEDKERLSNRILELKKINNIVFEKDIKVVCKKYRLKCLPSGRYIAQVPRSVLSNISKREDLYDLNGKLYIIAPKKHFSVEYVKKDPILLEKLSDGVYRVLDHWGNDFGWTRRVSSFILNILERLLVFCPFIIGIALLIIARYYFDTPANVDSRENDLPFYLCNVFGFVACVIGFVLTVASNFGKTFIENYDEYKKTV